MTAEDLFSDVDGLVNDSGVIACEVNTGETVAIGNVVIADVHVDQGMPKIGVCGAGEVPLGVVIALGEGASGAAGKIVSVALVGSGIVVKCQAKTAFTVNDWVKSAALGEVQALTTTTVVADWEQHVGKALQTSGEEDDEVLICLA